MWCTISRLTNLHTTHNTHTLATYTNTVKHGQPPSVVLNQPTDATRDARSLTRCVCVCVCENVWVRECMKPTYGNRLHYYISASQSGHRSTVGRIFWGSLSILRADFPFNAIFLLYLRRVCGPVHSVRPLACDSRNSILKIILRWILGFFCLKSFVEYIECALIKFKSKATIFA